MKHATHEGHDHDGHVDECRLEIDDANRDACRPVNDKHVHGAGCGHAAVPHGDHTDYLVDGARHHPHADHCDDHGRVDVV